MAEAYFTGSDMEEIHAARTALRSFTLRIRYFAAAVKKNVHTEQASFFKIQPS